MGFWGKAFLDYRKRLKQEEVPSPVWKEGYGKNVMVGLLWPSCEHEESSQREGNTSGWKSREMLSLYIYF